MPRLLLNFGHGGGRASGRLDHGFHKPSGEAELAADFIRASRTDGGAKFRSRAKLIIWPLARPIYSKICFGSRLSCRVSFEMIEDQLNWARRFWLWQGLSYRLELSSASTASGSGAVAAKHRKGQRTGSPTPAADASEAFNYLCAGQQLTANS